MFYQLRTLSLLEPVLALFPAAELAFPSGPKDQTMTVVLASKLFPAPWHPRRYRGHSNQSRRRRLL